MQALIELVPTILTPGMAYPWSLAVSSKSTRACPVTTPGFTEAGNLAKAYVHVASLLTNITSGNRQFVKMTPKSTKQNQQEYV